MKQNKKYLVVFLLIILLISVLSIPAFADDTYPSVTTYFLQSPVFNDSLYTNTRDYGVDIYNIYYGYNIMRGGSLIDNTYFCLIGTRSNYKVYAFTYSDTTPGNQVVIACYQDGGGATVGVSLTSYDTNFYYASLMTGYTANDHIDFYCNFLPDLATAQTEFISFINNNPSPPTQEPFDLNYSVPAGNVLYIDLGSNYSNITKDFTFYTTFKGNSQLGSNPFPVHNLYFGYADSLPTNNTSFPLAGMNHESDDWLKYGDTNLLGQTKNAYSPWSNQHPTGRYLVVYAALATPGNIIDSALGYGSNFENSIRVVISDVYDSFIYPLTSSVYQIGNSVVSGGTVTDSSDVLDITYDTDTDTVITTDPNGIETAPVVGGNTQVTVATEDISDILNKFLSSFQSIFTKTYDAIRTLVGFASDFVSNIQSLYTWLPAPVFSVLTSALILVITIGVLKVFL